jgi:hypothetical protein
MPGGSPLLFLLPFVSQGFFLLFDGLLLLFENALELVKTIQSIIAGAVQG